MINERFRSFVHGVFLALIIGYVIGLLSARGKNAGAPARK